MKLTFEQRALEETLTDYTTEVDHQRERVARLERAIDEAVDHVPVAMRAVIDALQSLRGVSKLTATTIVAEVGELSRVERASQLIDLENPRASVAVRLRPEPAREVRDSSRRIKTKKASLSLDPRTAA